MRMVWALVLLGWALPVWAGDLPQEVLDRASAAYAAGHYDEAFADLTDLKGFLGVVPLLDSPKGRSRAEIFFDLGRIHIAAGDTAAARPALESAFALEPQNKQGVLSVPPDRALVETQRFLERMRLQQRNAELQATTVWRAAGRSLVLPGWGQLYRGHTRQGYAFMGAAAALTVAWLVADRAYSSANKAYHQTSVGDLNLEARTGGAEDVHPFEDRYNKALSRAHTANLVIGMLAAVWATNVLDHLVIGPAHVTLELQFH